MGYYNDRYDYDYDETYERVNRYEIVTTYENGKVEKWWEYDEDDAKCIIDHIEESPEDYDGISKVEIIEEVEEVGVIHRCSYGYEEEVEYIESTNEYTIYTKEF